MKAEFIKDLEGWNGHAKLYRVTPPVKYDDGESDHVAVSAVNSAWANETYIFPTDQDGKVKDWGELPGSQRGNVSHEVVLKDAGYKIA